MPQTSALATAIPELSSTRLERVFADCFAHDYNTVLIGGAAEPLYVPATGSGQHKLYYRDDFFASALHETAHWCIAGAARRQQRDFGYWYATEGRDSTAQRAFEAVEAAPQALEWFFSQACGWPFQVSVDNLDPQDGTLPDTRDFCDRVVAEALARQSRGLPERAAIFYRALCVEFGSAHPAQALTFRLADLL